MAEPSPKRLKSGLPLCTLHRHSRALSQLVKQNFPPVVEEGLCGVASALLEVSYVFQMLVRPPRHDSARSPRLSPRADAPFSSCNENEPRLRLSRAGHRLLPCSLPPSLLTTSDYHREACGFSEDPLLSHARFLLRPPLRCSVARRDSFSGSPTGDWLIKWSHLGLPPHQYPLKAPISTIINLY